MTSSIFTQISCRRVAPLLFAQSENARLSPRDTARLQAHLAKCALCQREASEIAAFASTLRHHAPAPALPPADLWSRIEAEIAPPDDSPVPLFRPSMRPLSSAFVPRLGTAAWAGSLAIVVLGGAWMTYGGGFWGHAHGQNASLDMTSLVVRPNLPPATVTILPSPAATTAAPRTAVVASVPAAKPDSVLKAVRTLTPRSDPFAPLPSPFVLAGRPSRTAITTVRESSYSVAVAAKPSAHRVAVEAAKAMPTPAASTAFGQTGVRVAFALFATLPAVPNPVSDTVADTIAAASSVQSPTETATMSASATFAAAAKPVPVISSASASETDPLSASASLSDEAVRSVPPSGGGSGAFSVADAPSRAKRQQALFSYSRP